MAKKGSKNEPARSAKEIEQEKKEAFVRVVPTRVRNATKALDLVALCAGRNYVSSANQKNAVVTEIEAHFEALKKAYAGEAATVGGFELPKD